jgi:hypothetical protein
MLILLDEKPPTILADKDYPAWVFDIGKKVNNKLLIIANITDSDVSSLGFEQARINR